MGQGGQEIAGRERQAVETTDCKCCSCPAGHGRRHSSSSQLFLFRVRPRLSLQIAVTMEAHSWAKADRRLREENDELSRRLTALERGPVSRSRPGPFESKLDEGSGDDEDLDGLLDQVLPSSDYQDCWQ